MFGPWKLGSVMARRSCNRKSDDAATTASGLVVAVARSAVGIVKSVTESFSVVKQALRTNPTAYDYAGFRMRHFAGEFSIGYRPISLKKSSKAMRTPGHPPSGE